MALSCSLRGQVASHKAKGGMKQAIYTVTFDAAYPDDGYTEAQLMTMTNASKVKFSNIFAVLPMGPAVAADGETAHPIGWSFLTNTLKAYQQGGDGDPLDEVPDNESTLENMTADVLILGN